MRYFALLTFREWSAGIWVGYLRLLWLMFSILTTAIYPGAVSTSSNIDSVQQIPIVVCKQVKVV